MIIIKSQITGRLTELSDIIPSIKTINGIKVDGRPIILGKYESEGRIKEVMSMIEHHIASMYFDINNQMNPIFTMPEK